MNDTVDTKAETRPAATLAEVIRRLRARETEIRALHATALHLFGSAARDEMTAASDIDLFIDYDDGGQMDFFKLCEIERIAMAATGRNVDLTTRAGLHDLLRERIEKSTVRIF